MFGARSKADCVVKRLPVDHDLVSELRFSGLDPVRRLYLLSFAAFSLIAMSSAAQSAVNAPPPWRWRCSARAPASMPASAVAAMGRSAAASSGSSWSSGVPWPPARAAERRQLALDGQLGRAVRSPAGARQRAFLTMPPHGVNLRAAVHGPRPGVVYGGRGACAIRLCPASAAI